MSERVPASQLVLSGGAKLPIGNARSSAADTVAAANPGPPHRIANEDVEHVRHKLKALPYRHIENLAGSRWRAVRDLSAVLIDNANGRTCALFLCRDTDAPVARFNWRHSYDRKHHRKQANPPRS